MAHEWDARAYDRISTPQQIWGRKVLDRLRLAGDETVLDVGCGSGRLTAELLERLPRGRVLAVDSSASMLSRARATLRRFGRRATLVQADALALGLSEAADVVFSTATFHWVLDHERLYAELFRALAPGGRLVAQCGGSGNLERFLARVRALVAAPPFRARFAGWREPWLFAGAERSAALLRAAGFVDVQASLEPGPTRLPDAAAFREFVAKVVCAPHLERLGDPALVERFLAAVTRDTASEDPPWTLDYVRLNLSATRPAGRTP